MQSTPHISSAPSPVLRFFSHPVVAIITVLWAYLCTVGMALAAPRYLPPGALREVVVWLPMLTTALAVSVIYGFYRGSDEYVRQRLLRCGALTGVALAFGTLGYFCLERNGYAPLSMISVNLCGWTVFALLAMWVLTRAR